MDLRSPRSTGNLRSTFLIFNLAFLFTSQFLEELFMEITGPPTLRILASTIKLAVCNTLPCLIVGAHSLRHSCSRPGHSLCARSARAIFSGVHIFPLFGAPSSAEEPSPNTSSNRLRTASSRQGTSSSAAAARQSIARPIAQYAGSASQDLACASARRAPSTAVQLSGLLGAEAERGRGGCARRSRPEWMIAVRPKRRAKSKSRSSWLVWLPDVRVASRRSAKICAQETVVIRESSSWNFNHRWDIHLQRCTYLC